MSQWLTLKVGRVCTSGTWSTDPYKRSGKLGCNDALDFEVGQKGML